MKTVAMGSDETISQNDSFVVLNVYIPDLLIQKNYQFQKDEFVWEVKQQIIDSLPKELKESFNYGIFCPPINGKAGKFLDEQRPIADYPFHGPTGYVELRYKRRVYKMLNIEEKQIKQLHTRANLRRMLDYVNNTQIEKITKMCARGMDPNFHCPESGETPLTLATCLKQPAKVIMALINGGALLDFRTKEGLTALHKAVERNNLEALKTLLDLGASPNYKDGKGLTPLYYTLLYSSDHLLTELLLHDHAFIGTCDPQGWQEVHQSCKHGLVQHLEHLLFYGADMNARNASGNTPLHVCAVNDQESCARVLLFRGAEKNAINFANQNPYQVAVIAGNLNLGELIRNHSEDDIVPYREMPRYNPRRRASIAPVATFSRTHSDPRLDLSLGMKPPSPCPSNCSLPPFSSISCISDASTGSSSTYTHPSEKSVTSDSSGVCTSNSAASYESGNEQHDVNDGFLPGNICMCIEDYKSPVAGHLQVAKGETIEVIKEVEEGHLIARTDSGQEGFIPISCVQEISSKAYEGLPPSVWPRVEGRRERSAKRVSTIPRRWRMFGEPRTVILHKGKKGFGFVLRGAKAISPLMEREPNEFLPSLQYLDDVDTGGVADMAGLRKGDYLLEINGQDVSQASHEHVVSIIRQSGNLVAMTVITAPGPPVGTSFECVPLPYRQCATLPRKLVSKKAPAPPKRDPKTTLSVGRVRARSMVAGLAEIEALDRTLCEYDSEGRSTKSSSVESIPNKVGIKTSDGQLTKTASIKARPSSQRISASELEQFFARQGSIRHLRCYSTLNSRPGARNRPPKVYGSVAAMKRSRASRSKIVDSIATIHKEFHSTPDLKNEVTNIDAINNDIFQKKSLSQEDILNTQNSRHSWACMPNGFSSALGICDNEDYSLYYRDSWKSIEDVYDTSASPEGKDKNSDIYAQTLPLRKKDKLLRASCPPPSHPPPPPPVGQVVKVDVSKSLGDYANLTAMDDERNPHVMSSFRPGDSAKLYASPEIVMSVGYRCETLNIAKEIIQQKRAVSGGSSLRSQSLPPKIPGNKSDRGSTTSSEAENSGDSGGLYSTFKKPSRQRDSMSTDSGHVSDRGTLRSLKGKPVLSSAYASKFEFEDSDASSPKNYSTVRTPSHEPFIPEPDYESSEDDYMPTSVDQGGTLSTFGKGDSSNQDNPSVCPVEDPDQAKSNMDNCPPPSPHTEAKRAIQEARERLRFSQKPIDKNATVVFISGKITEHKVEKSEIQLHRTEEGRLTGTVVISTANEPQESLYLSSSILKTYDNEKGVVPRYPSRDAPASEYAKYRQQILSGMNQNLNAAAGNGSTPPAGLFQNAVAELTERTVFSEPDGAGNAPDLTETPLSKTDGLKIALIKTPKPITEDKRNEQIEKQFLCPKEIYHDDAAENSSSGVSSDIETQSDHATILSSSTEDDSKAETVVLLSSRAAVQAVDEKRDLKNDHEKFPATSDSSNKTLSDTKGESSVTKNLAEESSLPIKLDAAKQTENEVKSKCKSISNEVKAIDDFNIKLSKAIQNRMGKLMDSPSKQTVKKNIEETKSKAVAESNLDESLEVLRLQVSSLGLAAVNEVDVFTELVPPPPEFAAAAESASNPKEVSYSHSEIAIAPPPEFSDRSPHSRGRSSRGSSHGSSQRSSRPSASHFNAAKNSVDLAFLASLSGKSPNVVRMLKGDKKCSVTTNNGSINLHLPCSSGHRHVSSNPSDYSLLHDCSSSDVSRLKSVQKEFRFKSLQEWTSSDIADWLDSLFLPEYKYRFSEAGITGAKLANMDSNDLMGLGVKQMGHRLNMERSLKRYLK